MKPHQRIALALRVARSHGATVHVEPTVTGTTIRFRVPSPPHGIDIRAAAAITEAGFTVPNLYATGFRGWQAECPVPGYRATEYLFSLDGEGPLPIRTPRAVRRAAPRDPAAPRKPRTRKPRALPPPRDAADLMASLGIAVPPDDAPAAPEADAPAHAGPATVTPPVTVLRRTRKAA